MVDVPRRESMTPDHYSIRRAWKSFRAGPLRHLNPADDLVQLQELAKTFASAYVDAFAAGMQVKDSPPAFGAAVALLVARESGQIMLIMKAGREPLDYLES